MARSFASASSQYAYATGFSVAAPPVTLAAWFYLDTTPSGANGIMTIADTAASADSVELSIEGVAPYRLQATMRAFSTNVIGYGGNVTASQWNHAAAVFTSTPSRQAYLNGSAGTADTTGGLTSGLDAASIGAYYRGASPQAYLNGKVAHAAIWNVALSSSEILKLYGGGIGVDPRSVRPDALVAYWPLLNNDGDQDYWGNFHLTTVNSPTYAQHPPVLMRSRPKYVVFGAAGGAPTISSVTITGTRTVSNTLTANVVTDPETVDSIAYQWEISDDGGDPPTNGADLTGETAATLALTYADFASRLDANGEAYVRVGAIATVGAESSAESFSDWVRVTAGGSGVVRPIGQSVYISV